MEGQLKTNDHLGGGTAGNNPSFLFLSSSHPELWSQAPSISASTRLTLLLYQHSNTEAKLVFTALILPLHLRPDVVVDISGGTSYFGQTAPGTVE